MSTAHVLVGERVSNPSRSQIRKIIGQSHVAAGFRMKEGYLYTVVRAISARVNQNYDGWPSYELKEAAHTFVGKPVFVNHENFDPDKARGVVVAARYRENGSDKYIETVMEIDAKRFPLLAKEIKTGGLDSVSMGAEAGFTICSACGNKAQDEPEMCDHVKYHKGEKIHVRNRKTGKVEEKLVYESCHKLSFFELSYVFDPADETAVASKVVMGSRRTAASDCAPGDPNCAGSNNAMDLAGGGDIGLQNSGGGGSSAGGGSSSGAATPNPGLGKTPGVGGGAGSGGTPQPGDAKNMPQTKPLYDQLQKEFPGSDIGTYRVDDYHEHDHGAMDFMTKDPSQADKVRQDAFAAGAPYVLWQQQQWNPDGSTSKMEDRGSPTQNHMDHVHIAPIGTKPSKSAIRTAILDKLAGPTDDYLRKLEDGTLEDEIEQPTGPAIGGGPSRSQQQWLQKQKRRGEKLAELPPPENSQHTQRSQTMGSYIKAHDYFDKMGAPTDGVLDYGAGLGHSSKWGHTYEPHPREGFKPTYVNAEDVPEAAHGRVTNLNVLNVVPPEIRDQIVDGIGRTMAPGGHAIITTRGANEVAQTKSAVPADNGDPGAFVVNPGTSRETYQKGFTPRELHQYVSDRLGPNYSVSPVKIGPAGVHIIRHAGVTAMTKERIAQAIYRKLAWGETEAPPAVDTLREEGSAPEDDNDDFHHYVESPQELSMPDLNQATQLDREQEDQGQGGPGQAPAGDPGEQGDEGQYMTLKIPVPSAAPPVPAGPPASAIPQGPPAPMPMPPGGGMAPAGAPPAAPPTGAAPQTAVPMQAFGSRAASQETLAYMERYFGYRVADWREAIEAGRDLNPEEQADFIREASVVTLENGHADSPTGRNPVKGTANMARSTLANRQKTAATRHFAEGPLTDGGDQSRNDEGEQEEAFITSVPSPEPASTPKDGEEISNTESNLVADEAYARSLTSKLQQQKRELEATAREYARIAGIQKRADEFPGGEYATEVNPSVQNPASEKLTGDHFDSPALDEIDTSPGGPGTTSLPIESSLQAFRAFDKWLTASTGKSSRQHTESNIKKAATQFANYNGVSTQVLFPALGIALRQARKTEAAKKGAKMRKRAVDLETAAPDDRVSVPAPVADVTDAEAQASQFHEDGYANNAGDNLADPDQSTGQNFAPGQAPKTSKKADGILSIRCAEAMIAAGLEPNTRERKYQLAAEFSKMSRGLILDRTALAERFAMVRHADRQKVASGSTRGAARSPIPAGLGQGGSTRQASTNRVAANNPENDALLFG